MRRFAASSAVCWLAGLFAGLGGGGLNRDHLVIAALVAAALGAKLRFRQYAQAAGCLLIFVAAALYGLVSEKSGVSVLPEEAQSLELTGHLASPVKIDGDRLRFVLRTMEPGRERVMTTVRAASPEEREAAAAWRRGDAITVTGELSLPAEARNFGQFDYRLYLDRQRIWRTLTAEGLDSVRIEVPGRLALSRYALMRWTDQWRAGLERRIRELYPRHHGLMSGLLIGMADNLEAERFMTFSRLGLTHIIAISGLHVAIVVGSCLGIFRLLRLTRETSLAAAMLLIPPYMLLSGMSPSVVRAGIMAMIALYAAKRGWLKDGLNILAAAALLMTLVNPYLIYNISFQLSFTVTAGLIVLTPATAKLLPERPKWMAGALAVGIAAQLASFPLSISYFNQFSLLSLPANLLLVPLYSVIVLPGGYLTLVLSYLPLPLARLLAKAVAVPIAVSYRLMDVLDAVPGMLTIWATPSVVWIVVYYGLLLGIMAAVIRCKGEEAELYPRRRRTARTGLIALTALLGLWLVIGFQWEHWRDRGSVSFLDVGQGDAILIRTPDDRIVLVDGGGTLRFGKPEEQWRLGDDPYEVGKDLLVPLLKKRGIRAIDYVIATHGDADHIGGLAAVIEQIPVKRLLFNGTLRKNEPSLRLFQTALHRNIPIHAIGEGDEIRIGKQTAMTVLHPEPGRLTVQEEQNARSVVFVMRMRSSTFLFTGDMDAAAERDVLARIASRPLHPAEDGGVGGGGAAIDVLKIAHHGSKTSTTAAWLHYWQPRLSVISVGERNVYRHPSPQVLRRLTDRGIAVLRTDLHGEIQFSVGQGELKWRTKREAGGEKGSAAEHGGGNPPPLR